jgi:very-short-patch-repair endonuclease
MQLKAMSRMEEYKRRGEIAPMHTNEAIRARATLQTDNFLRRVQAEYNVTILDRIVEQDVLEFTVHCNQCNNIFTQYHQSYFTCWTCNIRHRSLKEQELIDIITTLNVPFITNCRNVLSNHRELDFYFPEHNLAIEFNGLYWHSELRGKDRNYHLQKTIECEQQGIHLLHIFEDEWEHHKEIIVGKIKSLLQQDNRITVYARNTEIREVSSTDSRTFLDTHHLQGADSAKYRWGLFYHNVLISVMTFSKPNASKGNTKNVSVGTYELSRYCSHTSYRCTGGASKLLKHFIKVQSPQKIISYADRRYSIVGKNVYEQLGFTLSHISSPNYWYFTSKQGLRRFHRFNFTKKKTISLGGCPTKTEWENMIGLGYDRIWDCGHLKYELRVV